MKVKFVREAARIQFELSRDLYNQLESFATGNNMSPEYAVTVILTYFLSTDRLRDVLTLLGEHLGKEVKVLWHHRFRAFLLDMKNEIDQQFGKLDVDTATDEYLNSLLVKLNQNPWVDEYQLDEIEMPESYDAVTYNRVPEE